MKYKLIIDKSAEEEIVATVHAPSLLTTQIENLVCNYTGADFLLCYNDDEIKKLSFDQIECITVIDRKVTVIDSESNQYRIQDRLRELENVLPTYFIRLNKSTLANEHAIVKFKAIFNGSVDAIFKCGYREYVSRRCFAEIRRRYEGK